MKYSVVAVVGALVLAGCSNGSESVVIKNDGSAPKTVDKAVIETCWKESGIKSDLYRFMTPSQALGLQAGGVVSAQQLSVFKACLAR